MVGSGVAPLTIDTRDCAGITWDEMEMELREKYPDVWNEVDRLIKCFEYAGATVTDGSGRLFVDGKETDIVSALKAGFCDT